MAMTFTGAVPVPKPQSSPLTVLVTGASRGLGLEFVTQYATAHAGNVVFAGARNPSSATALKALAAQHSNVHIVPLDVDSEDNIRASLAHVDKVTDRLDVLINNAAVSGGAEAMDPITVSAKLFTSVFNTNVVGPLLVTQTYLPHLRRSPAPKVLNVSSVGGSNGLAAMIAAHGHMMASYAVSKAALNLLNTTFCHAVPTVTFLAVHPGWVATDGGSAGGTAPTRVDQSVQAMRYYIAEKGISNSGEFFDINGDAVPY